MFRIHRLDTTDQGVAMFRDRHRTTLPAIGIGVVAAFALAACSAGSSGSSSASSAIAPAGGVQDSRGQSVGGTAIGAPAPNGKSPSTGTGVDPAALQAGQDALARRATIALQVKNIGQAVARVRATSAAADGIILDENIGTADGPVPLADSSKVSATTYAEITISVPSDQLDAVIADLGSVGTVIRSTSSSENVGSQIVDTQSRLDTMRVSVERVRGFLRSAKDLTQIVTLEAELTRRESDLEALEAQLASLKGSVARSPVQVSLTTVAAVIAPPATATGFLAGLKGGWKAFTASVSVVLTVLGAVLPFAVVAALLGLPVWWYVRRRRLGAAPPVVSAG
ncbi:DUF4349 domain-containing protein [Nostocoides sp. HKS02]|uniref:DUF4349 domain-containing protein n=1 Tax=Nostocoides sp. HKS02 TaxID=1813880 RepID=UPI0012B446EB|nr:DUF4349 domain-containing protein [Tetrasphaera sp. HKS02]QGN57503.1 DUF4349 domain-containing protein [Tetrasphaera sp. HKS02]